MMPAVVLSAYGVGESACLRVAFRRACRQTHYKPVFEDWCWYGIVPAIVYEVSVVGALLLSAATVRETFEAVS